MRPSLTCLLCVFFLWGCSSAHESDPVVIVTSPSPTSAAPDAGVDRTDAAAPDPVHEPDMGTSDDAGRMAAEDTGVDFGPPPPTPPEPAKPCWRRFDLWGKPINARAFEYDALGRVVKELIYVYEDDLPVLAVVEETTYSPNSRVWAQDAGPDGQLDEVITTTFDERGRVVRVVDIYDVAGQRQSVAVTDYRAGYSVRRYDDEDDGTFESETTTWYDGDDRPVRSVFTGDPVTIEHRYEYDHWGQLIRDTKIENGASLVTETTFSEDWREETIERRFEGELLDRIVKTYDDQHLLLSEWQTDDRHPEPRGSVYAYDDQQRLIYQQNEIGLEPGFEQEVFFEYDCSGR